MTETLHHRECPHCGPGWTLALEVVITPRRRAWVNTCRGCGWNDEADMLARWGWSDGLMRLAAEEIAEMKAELDGGERKDR